MRPLARRGDPVEATNVRIVSRLPLLIGFLAGPILWSLHELISEILISSACSYGMDGFNHFTVGSIAGWELVLLLLTLFFLLLGVVAEVIAVRSWLKSHVGTDVSGAAGGAAGRSGWMSMAGILLSTIFLVAIVFEGVPIFYLSGCG